MKILKQPPITLEEIIKDWSGMDTLKVKRRIKNYFSSTYGEGQYWDREIFKYHIQENTKKVIENDLEAILGMLMFLITHEQWKRSGIDYNPIGHITMDFQNGPTISLLKKLVADIDFYRFTDENTTWDCYSHDEFPIFVRYSPIPFLERLEISCSYFKRMHKKQRDSVIKALDHIMNLMKHKD